MPSLRHIQVAIAAVLLGILPAKGAADLLAAYKRGDEAELARTGRALGASGLAAPILRGPRLDALAAIRASVSAEDAWALLDELGDRARDPDRSIAVAAATSAVTIAGELSPAIIDAHEIAQVQLSTFASIWGGVALDRKRHADIRILAIEVCSLLAGHISKQPSELWQTLLEDADDQVRYAALILSSGDASIDVIAEKKLLSDAPWVALGAGQRLCGPLGSNQEPRHVAPELLARLRALALDRTLAVVARADLAPCLSRDRASRGALDRLLQEAPAHLRPALSRLVKR